MERAILSRLTAWKQKPRRKPLLMTGVRQCGKTYAIQQFGAAQFEHMAYCNFDGNDGLKSIFEYDFDTARILEELCIFLHESIVPGKTLLVFDEIQDCPRAIQSLKYFCENVPELHLIAAGSLLGVAIRKEEISFPVGKVDRLEMFPMTFEEFAAAVCGERYVQGLSRLACEREIPELYRTPMEKTFRNYCIVGGMPEAVQTWIDTHDYNAVDEVQGQILKDYADDFAKHTTAETAAKIRLIWNSIPTQIAKENNKFIFSHVKAGARAKDLEDALAWLVHAGLVYKTKLVESPELPLSSRADETYFKVYMADVGLLRKLSNVNYRTILEGDAAYVQFKGALTENYVLTQLQGMGITGYFWRTKSNAEVDFIVDHEGVMVPIEVKSADNVKAKILHLFCKRYQPKMALKVSLKNVGDSMDGSTHVWSIPLYVLFRYKDYLFHEMNW